MLDAYIHHIKNITKNKSLLARIYGLFTIKTKGLRPINLIIMQNTACLRNAKKKLYEFDLKGSMYGRRTPIKNKHDKKNTLKDLNFIEI